MRVSPSGKAQASQACIRGFESRHPLHEKPARPDNIRPRLFPDEGGCMAFDTFVFDLDGTLLDTLPDLVVITNQALGELGFPPRSHDEILSYVGNGGAGAHVPGGARRHVARTDRRRHGTLEGALPRLWQRPDEAVSSHEGNADRAFGARRQDGRALEQVRCRRAAGHEPVHAGRCSPSCTASATASRASPILPACCAPSTSWAPPPTRTAYVGDSPGDVKVAQNAGAFAIGVSWGYHHADELRAAQANVVIDSPEELLRFASERS